MYIPERQDEKRKQGVECQKQGIGGTQAVKIEKGFKSTEEPELNCSWFVKPGLKC